MSASLPRRLLAEFVGTGLLVLFGAGSVVAALTMNGGRLAYGGLGIIALAFGLVVALVIYAVGTTSGAHINPAVTVGLAAVPTLPLGRGRAVRGRAAARRRRRCPAHRGVRRQPGHRLRQRGPHGSRPRRQRPAGHRRRGARDVPAGLHDHGGRGRQAGSRRLGRLPDRAGGRGRDHAHRSVHRRVRQPGALVRPLPGEPALRRVDAVVGVLRLHRRTAPRRRCRSARLRAPGPPGRCRRRRRAGRGRYALRGAPSTAPERAPEVPAQSRREAPSRTETKT